jgi:DNA polymerase elongation subunit (family B)
MEYDINELNRLVSEGNPSKIKAFMAENNLELINGSIIPKDISKKYFKEQNAFWDMRQLARKILLNSLYGALMIVPLCRNAY